MLYCIKGGRLRDHRDRALIALGTAAALRRSELVALRVEDLQHVPEGLRVRIARSKTDRDGAGKVVAVPSGKRIRPVALVDAWLEAASIADGFVFRRFVSRADHLSDLSMDDAGVALVVKRRAAAAGLTAAEFNGRSLRSGFLTAAARAGASIWKMQEVSRHKSVQVFSGYVRSAELFDDHAGSGFLRSEVTDMLAGVGCQNTIWSSAHAASMQPASVVGRLPQCVYLIAGSLALGLHGGNPEISFAVREGSTGMDLSAYRLLKEPFYQERDVEVPIMEAACQQGVPVMLKGPTGCGKTRFVEYIAWRLGRPLITVSCHEDMTAADLVGRHLLTAEGTVWHDGPLTLAVRHGAICYLDEVVEARQDTTVVIHPLGDSRRTLPSSSWCPTTPASKARSRTSRNPRNSASSPSSSAIPTRRTRLPSLPGKPGSAWPMPACWSRPASRHATCGVKGRRRVPRPGCSSTLGGCSRAGSRCRTLSVPASCFRSPTTGTFRTRWTPPSPPSRRDATACRLGGRRGGAPPPPGPA